MHFETRGHDFASIKGLVSAVDSGNDNKYLLFV